MTPTDRREHREGSRTQDAPSKPSREARTISCPFCSRRYRLPAALMGPRGARITCPGCQGRYVLALGPTPHAKAVRPVEPMREAREDGGETVGDAPTAHPTESVPHPADAPSELPPVPETTWHATGPPPLPEVDAAQSDARDVAVAVLDALARETGARLASAHAHGRLFAEFGPHLLDAFDDYRAQAGDDADPGLFRHVLRLRCGVDLGLPG